VSEECEGNPNRARKEADPNPNPDRKGGDNLTDWPTAHATNAPLAYLITFRTYGTWLPGDDRGTVDREHNQPDTPPIPANPALHRSAKIRADSPVALSDTQRKAVHDAILSVCEHRGWTAHALNVRTNHVHVVVSGAASPERIMNTFKSWATRRLRDADLIHSDTRTWSRHGSTRYLWKQEQIEAAYSYVMEAQDEDRTE